MVSFPLSFSGGPGSLDGKMFSLSFNGGGISFYPPYWSPPSTRYPNSRFSSRPYFTTARPRPTVRPQLKPTTPYPYPTYPTTTYPYPTYPYTTYPPWTTAPSTRGEYSHKLHSRAQTQCRDMESKMLFERPDFSHVFRSRSEADAIRRHNFDSCVGKRQNRNIIQYIVPTIMLTCLFVQSLE